MDRTLLVIILLFTVFLNILMLGLGLLVLYKILDYILKPYLPKLLEVSESLELSYDFIHNNFKPLYKVLNSNELCCVYNVEYAPVLCNYMCLECNTEQSKRKDKIIKARKMCVNLLRVWNVLEFILICMP